MITFSDDRIKSLLSLPGNNKCLECESTLVEWVSFPTTIFLCSSCGRKHKNFSNNEIIKSLSISEFTQKEEEKLKIGGNDRYLTFLKEYNISLTEPNIESKYSTYATAYYNALIEAEINKNNNVSGSEQTLNKLISQKPSNDLGSQIIEDTPNIYMELINSIPSNKEMGFGGFFGFIGNQIYNASEQLGINKVYNDAKNAVNLKMNEYGIKEAIEKGVDYAKSAGQYVVDKGKEISSTSVVQGAVSKVKEGVNYVNESATSMLANINGKSDNNNNMENNNQQQNNLDFLNDNNNQGVYQQLNHDQI